MTRYLPTLLLALSLLPACSENPYGALGDPPDDDDAGDDDTHPGDDDDSHPGDDDDSHPGDDDDSHPDFPGSCSGQPTSPSPSPIDPPALRVSFGSNGGHRGSPLLLDADADGDLDVISAENAQVSAYDLDGTVLWQGPIASRSYSGAILANVDGSPGQEVVAADGVGAIHVWEAHGPPLAGWPVQLEGHAEIRSLAAADLDGDGADEIVVMSTLNPLAVPETMVVLEGDGSVAPGWPRYTDGDPDLGLACPDCGGFNQNVAVGDLEGDGTLDLVFTQDTNSISIFDAGGAPRDVHGSFDNCGEGNPHHWGEIHSFVPFAAEADVTCGGASQILEFTYSPPLVADLEHDGNAEVLAVGNLEDPGSPGSFLGSALVVYQHARQHRPGFAPYHQSDGTLTAGEGVAYLPSPTVVAANLQGNPELEVLAVHVDGTLRCYDASGSELWSHGWTTGTDCVATEPLVADLDGDRVPEVILVSTCPDSPTSDLTVIGGAGDVRLEFELDFSTIATPLLADVDGDGGVEILFSSEDFYDTVRVYDWAGVDDSCLIWAQGRGDAQHRGWLR